ncbi:hypothetical protein SASPL_157722 [Salvia splendens]|uniref:Protein kinase domain-containing protein n=1 Tax=Salvia splendens TaxID=180675 RepID=A0A8X8YV18_SALSN|nr:hypothetical protein SASPL_157722 [Salvia splendens]
MSSMDKLRTLSFDQNYFNGSVPEWLDSWSNLTVLSLKNNRLNGEVPSAVARITTLIELVLSHNFLTGKMPDLSKLSTLQLLDLRENSLDSTLPPLPKGLVNVFLSKNSFSGSIPEQFVNYLNLSSNTLSGSLPEHLKCGEGLSLIDLSDNKMVGQLPNCLEDERIVEISGNCFSTDARDQHSASFCKGVSKGERRSRMREIALLAGIVVVVIIILLVGLMFFYKRHRTQHALVRHIAPKVKQDDRPISPDLLASTKILSEVENQSSPSYRVFTLPELKEATKNFDQSTFLGQVLSERGSYVQVYKGRLENGSFVAIRSLTLYRKCSIQNLKMRIDLLSKLRHPHLVALLGHCIDDGTQDDSTVRRLYLVQQFVPNGSFRSHLSEKVLKWPERLAVVIGAAKAIHFLHTGVIPPSLSNRLTTNSILIDEHGIAQLSDYGMSLIADETEKTDDDVHNFGFILLESLVGPIASSKGEAFLLNEMTSFSSQDGRRRIVEPIVLATSSQESLSIVISITNKCISDGSSGWPSFEDVLWNLQYAAQVQATADADPDSASHQSFG